MTNFLQTSKRDGSLVLWHDYMAGHALDLSGNGNHGTLSATCNLNHNGILAVGSGDEVTVADSAELRLTTGTIIAISRNGFLTQKSNEALIHKRLGASVNFYFFINATPSIVMYNGVTTSAIIQDVRGYHGVGCTFVNGAKPIAFLDADSLGVMGTALTYTPTTDTVEVCNYANSAGLNSRLSQILLFNRALSADEYRTAYLELLK